MRRPHLIATVMGAMALATLCIFRLWPGLARQAVATRTAASPSRPNVVLVSLDTTRADHLGCYGYSRPTSPNLDRLAAGGVRCTCARAQAPWTVPSHMSLFTSLLPSHNGVENDLC